MLTDNPLTEVPGPGGALGTPGERVRRLQRRRRLVREEVLAVLVLFLFLAATVAILATQWLSSGPAPNATGSHLDGGGLSPAIPTSHPNSIPSGGAT